MSRIQYTPKRAGENLLKIWMISFLVSIILAIPFTTAIFAWQVGHASSIGSPIYYLSDSYTLIAKAIISVCLASTVLALYTRNFNVAGFLIIISAVASWFIFNPLYHPFRLAQWLYSYWNIPQLQQIINTTLICCSCYIIASTTGILLIFKRRPIYASGTHGTAQLTYGDHLIAGNNLTDSKSDDINYKGLIIGRHQKDHTLLRYNGDQHLMTIAPTGKGKGVGSIIPNLIEYPHSVVQVDPKGENCNYTYEVREKMGQQVYVLDPFQESIMARKYGTNHFNPLDLIDPDGNNIYEQCNDIAHMFMPPDPKESYWIKAGRSFFCGLLIYICVGPEFNDSEHDPYKPELRSISTIIDLLTMQNKYLIKYASKISKLDIPLTFKKGANEILNLADSPKQLTGVLGTLNANLQILHSPYIKDSLSHSDFEVKNVVIKPSTLFIVLPQKKLDAYKTWMNLILKFIINAGTTYRGTIQSEAQVPRVLFMLDEFYNLGRMKSMVTNYSLLRGYGFTFWIFLQDLSQLQANYPNEWKSFISNSGIKQIFGTSESEEAEYISKFMGETTVFVESRSESVDIDEVGLNDATRGSSSFSERGRRLMTPDELQTMDENHQIILHSGHDPILSDKITYFKDSLFKKEVPTKSDMLNEKTKLQLQPLSYSNDKVEAKLLKIIYSKKDENSSSKDDTTDKTETKNGPSEHDKSRSLNKSQQTNRKKTNEQDQSLNLLDNM